MNAQVLVIIGAGGIGQAIARRQGSGKTILLADFNGTTLTAAADALRAAGHTVTTQPVDVSSQESVAALAAAAQALGDVVQVVHAAGVSPVQATAQAILAVNLFGTAVVLDEFGAVIAPGGSGIVISSMAGYMLPRDPVRDQQLAQARTDELLELPFLTPESVPHSDAAYALARRANHVRVQAASLRWGERGARVNSISPGIILTPLAQDEMSGPRAEGYRRMIDISPARRVGTADEVASAAAFLLGPEASFITGSDLLIDGGVIPALRAGLLTIGP
jgi:NAD(P)-dependent dehydrogenase (short-subunit alcohol dehydrogenase family)